MSCYRSRCHGRQLPTTALNMRRVSPDTAVRGPAVGRDVEVLGELQASVLDAAADVRDVAELDLLASARTAACARTTARRRIVLCTVSRSQAS